MRNGFDTDRMRICVATSVTFHCGESNGLCVSEYKNNDKNLQLPVVAVVLLFLYQVETKHLQ